MRGAVLKDILKAAVATTISFLLYSLLGKLGPPTLMIVNAFTLIVVFFSVQTDEVFGAVLGTICGLLQDSFSMGVFGVAGLTKTLLGFGVGLISRKLHVASFFRSFVFLFILVSGELVLWIFFYSLIFGDRIVTRDALIFFQPLTTAALGSSLLALGRKIKASKS